MQTRAIERQAVLNKLWTVSEGLDEMHALLTSVGASCMEIQNILH